MSRLNLWCLFMSVASNKGNSCALSIQFKRCIVVMCKQQRVNQLWYHAVILCARSFILLCPRSETSKKKVSRGVLICWLMLCQKSLRKRIRRTGTCAWFRCLLQGINLSLEQIFAERRLLVYSTRDFERPHEEPCCLGEGVPRRLHPWRRRLEQRNIQLRAVARSLPTGRSRVHSSYRLLVLCLFRSFMKKK